MLLTIDQKKERQSQLLRLAQVLRDNRLKRRSSNEEIAGSMKVSPTSLSEWRRGIRLMEGDNIYRVGEDIDVKKAAQQLGFTIYEVMNVPPPVIDPLLKDIIYHWDMLSDEDQQEIQHIYMAMLEKRQKGGGAAQAV